MEKVDIAFKIDKQIKKRLITAKALKQRAGVTLVVSSDTFKSEINSISNLVITTSSLINCLCSRNMITGKNNLSTYVVINRFVFRNKSLIRFGYNVLVAFPIGITVKNTVAAELKSFPDKFFV